MGKYANVSEEVISKAIDGDTEAFTEIYHTYYSRVYFMAIQFSNNNEETAKDIIQEIFIKVHKQFSTLKNPEAFSSWLYIISYRECLNHNRRKSNIRELRKDESIEEYEDINNISIKEKIENDMIRETVASSLDTMNPTLKTIGMLRFAEGLKVEEIANILGISRNTVGSRLRSIRKILSRDLEEQGITLSRNTVLGVISLPMMQEAFQLLIEKTVINETAALDILNKVLISEIGMSAAKTSSVAKTSATTKSVLGSMAVAATLGCVVMMNQGADEEISTSFDTGQMMTDYIPQDDSAKITTINYNTNWTNEPITIDVGTTNDNYNQILINDEETVQIEENGQYIIKLMRENKIIDQKEITVSNIDYDSPNGSWESEKNHFTIHLYDEVSQVYPNSIQLLIDGVESKDYTYDYQTNTITIDCIVDKVYVFYVSDYAGNILEINIE